MTVRLNTLPLLPALPFQNTAPMAGDQDSARARLEELGHVITEGLAMQQVLTGARKRLSI